MPWAVGGWESPGGGASFGKWVGSCARQPEGCCVFLSCDSWEAPESVNSNVCLTGPEGSGGKASRGTCSRPSPPPSPGSPPTPASP